MTKESYDEITKLLNQAIDSILNCEHHTSDNDAFKARALMGEVKRKLKQLMKESK